MPPPPDEPPSRAADLSPEPTAQDDVATGALAGGHAAPTFAREELVAARYRIVRFIAREMVASELAAGESIRRGGRRSARDHAAQLERDARAKGFGLIATKAAAVNTRGY